MRRMLMGLVTVAAVAGCGPRADLDEGLKSGGGHSSLSVRAGGSIAPPPPPPPAAPDPAAPRRAPQIVIILDVYDLTVPSGAISRNDEFWKRVDEDALDVASHDVLLKNGVRIGLGHDRDWTYFKGLLARYPDARQQRLRSKLGQEGYLELPMRTGIVEQILIGLDDQGVDWGRRFEKCDDLLAISYIASPHHPGETIVKACPIVRGLRQSYNVSVLNNEQTQIEPKHTDHLYDMRLEAPVPLDDFLIVAPSKQAATLTTSVGATFLTSDGASEPIEHVLLMVPHAYRSDEAPPPQINLTGK